MCWIWDAPKMFWVFWRAAVGDEEFLPGKQCAGHHREADRDHDSEAVLQQPQTEQSSGRIESSHPVCPPNGGEVFEPSQQHGCGSPARDTVPRKLLRLVEPGELERRSVPGSLFQVSQAVYIPVRRQFLQTKLYTWRTR